MGNVSFISSVCLLVILIFSQRVVLGEHVVALDDQNMDSYMGSSDILVVNFYATWCRFSQILEPIFEEAATIVHNEYPVPGKIVFGKVDCDKEVSLAAKYRISKYPTIKIIRHGQPVKKEYRGQRSAQAIAAFMQEQAKDSVQELASLDSLDELDDKKRHMIGYFESKQSDNYRTFARLASVLMDDCVFHAAFGPVSLAERTEGDRVAFRAPNTKHQDVLYTGQLSDYQTLLKWASEKCTPLVREITFENAEELTEEGLPFLILFHHPDDTASVEIFNQEVAKQLLHEKANVNFLVADGLKFAHPLHHLGKSTSDLPLLAIDSFRHMYLFPYDVKNDLATPGRLKQFIEDMHSGKLHREFHHGPDPTTPDSVQTSSSEDGGETKNIPREPSDEPRSQAQQKITSPPESTFRKLAPSRNRYTILRDEL